VDAYRAELRKDDPRRLLVGGFVCSILVFLSADADNLLAFLVTQVAASVGIVYLCSYRSAAPPPPRAPRGRDADRATCDEGPGDS
jgi:hypothetical protein